MQLKHLIDETNRDLYKRVTTHLPIQLYKSGDGYWTSNMEEKRIKIGYSSTNHPIAAFTHELLHIDTQLNGYRRLRSGLSLNPAVHQQLPFLCEAIDNEFQHHKMYSKFIEMGYDPDQFYGDLDAQAEQYISIGVHAPGQSLLSITNIYFTLIAPGGSIPQPRIAELKEVFRRYAEGAYREVFNTIDGIIEDWKTDPHYIAEPYIRRYMDVIGCVDTWISYQMDATDFPANGFFINRSFTMDEVYKAFGKS